MFVLSYLFFFFKKKQSKENDGLPFPKKEEPDDSEPPLKARKIDHEEV